MTTAEKEQIIDEKVEKFKQAQKIEHDRLLAEGKPISVHFIVTGPNYTALMRDGWDSEMPIYAVQKLGVEGMHLDLQEAIDVCTGKLMIIGDSRIENSFELVEDDGRFDFQHWSVEEVIQRREKKFIENSNTRAAYIRILTALESKKTTMKQFELAIMIGFLLLNCASSVTT